MDPWIVDQACLYYAQSNNVAWHVVVNDVDIEDILDFFLVVHEDTIRKREKKFDEAFNSL